MSCSLYYYFGRETDDRQHPETVWLFHFLLTQQEQRDNQSIHSQQEKAGAHRRFGDVQCVWLYDMLGQTEPQQKERAYYRRLVEERD
jgi:hypothetical protein